MMTKIRATVLKATGTTRHSFGSLDEAGPREIREMESAATIEIIPDEHGVLLVRYDKNAEFCGDTWHLSVEDAMQQAQVEYEVSPAEWTPISKSAE